MALHFLQMNGQSKVPSNRSVQHTIFREQLFMDLIRILFIRRARFVEYSSVKGRLYRPNAYQIFCILHLLQHSVE